MSKNVESPKIHPFHHKVFLKFRAGNGGWLKKVMPKNLIFCAQVWANAQIKLSELTLTAAQKSAEYKPADTVTFHPKSKLDFLRNLQFEASWH